MTQQEQFYRTKRVDVYLRWALIALALLLAFLLWRGCENVSDARTAYRLVKDTLESVVKDTSRVNAIARGYKQEKEAMDLRYEEARAEIDILQQGVMEGSDRERDLIAAIKKAKDSKDTVKIWAFIDTLSGENALLRQRIARLNTALNKKDSISDARLKISDSLAAHWKTAYDWCIAAAAYSAGELKKLQPSGKLYIDGSVIVGVITGVGVGGMYKDNRDKIFKGKLWLTNHGTAYEIGAALPIGLKRKK